MFNPVSWVLKKFKEINDSIWHTPISELSSKKRILIKQLRIIVLAARGFTNNKVQIRASALTFYSVLSIVPLAAIAFAISKGFGLEQNLTQQLTKSLSSQQEVLNWILPIAQNALKATNGGYIAGIGMIVLFWSVMSLLNHIEGAFNQIWEIKIPRAWYRKFTDYLTIMLIAPVLLILSSSVTVFINTKLTDYMAKAPILDIFKPAIAILIQVAPYLLIWLILTLLFIVMPNTKVRFGSALVAGVVSGTILQFLQWFYIDLQFGISKMSMLYGSFAAIPLFIVWLQMSWTVVLLGAEIAFANQNVSRYEFESEARNISLYQKRVLTIMIMHMIIRNFMEGKTPLSSESLSLTLKTPVRLVRDIVQDLNKAGLVSIVITNDSKERHFQPAMDINVLTVSYVLSKLDRMGIEQRGLLRNKDMERVNEILTKFEKCMAKSDHNVLIRDI
ncbi:MAG TPA: YihY/virulence factor BrkB family protein [Bacteroidales bacterium]|nr:YihY/virulence factor BrkB family protein [Bacteroidales bacterium]